jgi:serine protease inhibitor
MAGNGADGSTRSAMWKALALPGSNTAVLNASTEALQRILKDRGFA